MINLDFIGDVSNAAASMAQSLNPQYLETQAKVAEANARAAEANASKNQPKNNKKIIYAGIGVAVLIALIFLLKK